VFPTRDNNDPCEAVGVLACAMFEAEVLNPIIFVEEAGETLNQPHYATLLKDVLDPDNLVLRLRSLDGLQLDFSPSTVIFANNAPLTDAVLHTKLKQVIVARLTQAQKAQILADTLRGEVHGNNARLRTELRRKLEHAMGRLAPLLLDADASHDVPGARHLIRSSSRTHQVRSGATDHRRQCSSRPCTEADRGLVQPARGNAITATPGKLNGVVNFLDNRYQPHADIKPIHQRFIRPQPRTTKLLTSAMYGLAITGVIACSLLR
jgi:hypothetical protein